MGRREGWDLPISKEKKGSRRHGAGLGRIIDSGEVGGGRMEVGRRGAALLLYQAGNSAECCTDVLL